MPGCKTGLAGNLVCGGLARKPCSQAPEAAIDPSAWADKVGSLSELWRHLLRRNVYASMEQYTKVELLEGENQYRAEGLGMQVTMTWAWCVVFSLHVAGCLSMVYTV